MEGEVFQLLGGVGLDANTLLLGYLFWKLHNRVQAIEWKTRDCCGD